MSYYYEFAEDETDNYEEMERQIQEEKFFDECWEIHSAMMECIEDECIPILQNCKFDNFYKLCQQGEQYIVNLEKQDNIAKQKRLHFLQNLNKPIKQKQTKCKWITLGHKKKTDSILLPEPQPEPEKKPVNIMSKFNWTKK